MKYKIPDLTSVVTEAKAECEDFVKNGVWHEWYDDGYSHDSSGDTREIIVSKTDFIRNLRYPRGLYTLEQIYLGFWEPSFEPGYGKKHITLSDALKEKIETDYMELFLNINKPDEIEKDSFEYDDWAEEANEEFWHSPHWDAMHEEIQKAVEYFSEDVILQLLEN